MRELVTPGNWRLARSPLFARLRLLPHMLRSTAARRHRKAIPGFKGHAHHYERSNRHERAWAAPMIGVLSRPFPLIRADVAVILIAHIVLCYGAVNPAAALDNNGPARHPAALNHLPPFITPPDQTDVLLVVMAAVLVGAVLFIGVFFFWLHSLPERLVHNSTKVHFDIVAALALLSLFTHIHAFWVAALLIALVRIPVPDFTGPLGRIAGSLEKIADAPPAEVESSAPGRVNAGSRQASERPAPRRVTNA